MNFFIICLVYYLFIFVKSTKDTGPNVVGDPHGIKNIFIPPANYSSKGLFWQVTDIHWDLEYNEFGDKRDMCHESSDDPQNKSIGYYGNYLCDSPYPLIHSAFQAMKKIEPLPNFILWTGDNAPHTNHSEFSVIFRTIKNLTEELVTIFGMNTLLIPVLGNHDSFPKDDYPPSGEEFYARYLVEGGWARIIPVEAQNDFKKGGYYKVALPLDIDVLVLNTNLYYKYNELGQGLEDPGGQFSWMRTTLSKAKNDNRKVIVAAHAPPGYWERNAQVPFLNDSYNDAYVDIVNDFGHVIIAQIYGHEHTDSFRLFQTEGGDLRSVGFLAPSVTPWFPTRLDGGTAINPSVRLYSYAPAAILDYIQYHLNLTEANRRGTPAQACLSAAPMDNCEEVLRAQWTEYYRATEAFGVASLHAQEMARAYRRLLLDDDFFQKYYSRNSAGVNHGTCDDRCKVSHFCAISHLKIQPAISRCGSQQPVRPAFSHTGVAMVAIGVSLTIMLSTLFVVIGIRRRKMERGLRKAQVHWGARHAGYRPLLTADVD